MNAEKDEMKRFIVCISVLAVMFSSVFSVMSCSSDGDDEPCEMTAWLKQYGGMGREMGFKILETDDCGFIVSGKTYHVSYDQLEFHLLRMNHDGTIRWSINPGQDGSKFLQALLRTRSGDYILMGSAAEQQGLLILRINDSGTESARIVIEGLPSTFEDIVETPDGGFILAGYDYQEGLLVKISRDGSIEWQNSYEPGRRSYMTNIVATNDGQYVSCGWVWDEETLLTMPYLIKVTSDGETVWHKKFSTIDPCETLSLHEMNDGSLLIGGTKNYYSPYDGFMMKTDEYGTMQWVRWYSRSELRDWVIERTRSDFTSNRPVSEIGPVEITSIAAEGNGEIWFTVNVWPGYEYGPTAYLVHTDTSGEILEEKNVFFGVEQFRGSSVTSFISTSDGGYALTGRAMIDHDDMQIIVMKTDQFGNAPNRF